MEKNNFEVADLSKLRVNKATVDDFKQMEQGKGLEFGCGIAFTWLTGNSRSGFFMPTHPKLEKLVSEGKCDYLCEAAVKYYEGMNYEKFAKCVNWSVQYLMEKIGWEYADCGKYWSIHPATYFPDSTTLKVL